MTDEAAVQQTTLLMDIGHSRIKWSVLNPTSRSPQRSIAHHGLPSFAEALDGILSQFSGLPILCASVLHHEFKQTMHDLAHRHHCSVTFCSTAMNDAFDLELAYAQSERLGVDRWLAMLGAQTVATQNSFIVVDCGTAITLDAVTGEQHQGGLIFAGIRSGIQGLLDRSTLKWRIPQPTTSCTLFAKDTKKALDSGHILAAVCAVDGLCRSMALTLQRTEMQVYVCGGDAKQWFDAWSALPISHQPPLALNVQVHSDLVMQGLERVARHGLIKK